MWVSLNDCKKIINLIDEDLRAFEMIKHEDYDYEYDLNFQNLAKKIFNVLNIDNSIPIPVCVKCGDVYCQNINHKHIEKEDIKIGLMFKYTRTTKTYTVIKYNKSSVYVKDNQMHSPARFPISSFINNFKNNIFELI